MTTINYANPMHEKDKREASEEERSYRPSDANVLKEIEQALKEAPLLAAKRLKAQEPFKFENAS
jgi:hypothetical protein